MMNDSDDFHNPRRVPYVYQEFPRMLHMEGQKLIVKNTEEKQAALAKGWQLSPDAPRKELPSAADLDAIVTEQETATETQSPQVAADAVRGGKTPKAKKGK